MPVKSRVRRPGGGRKPKGNLKGKSENFSTRITPAARQALEKQAERAGVSVSQMAETLLMNGLDLVGPDENAKLLRAVARALAAVPAWNKNSRKVAVVSEALRALVPAVARGSYTIDDLNVPLADLAKAAHETDDVAAQERHDIARDGRVLALVVFSQRDPIFQPAADGDDK